MKKYVILPVLAALLAGSLAPLAMAEETRSLGAHQHGLSRLDIAIEGDALEMALTAPGADLVGFEHRAESDEQRAAVEAALQALEAPDRLFALPKEAGCVVQHVAVEAPFEDDHDHAAHEAHAHKEHSRKDNAHEDHGHGHDAREGGGHSEFSAEYDFACANPGALTRIDFPYFEAFGGAGSIDLRLITAKGAASFTVERSAPRLDISGAI